MPGLDGVELARVLRRFASPPALIFVSAYESAAVEAFELRALDYLMKPVSRARVAEALARITERPKDVHDTLAVDAPGGGTKLIRREDVIYLQAHGDYVRVVTADARHLVRGTLGEIERRWAPHGFHRVHRRFLVNLRKAAEVRPQLNGTALLIMADGAELPIARREVAELRRRACARSSFACPPEDLTQATAHGDVYLRRLRREQLRLALLSASSRSAARSARCR